MSGHGHQLVPDIRADGRFHVIQDVSTRANAGSETGGWLLGDEEDMTAPDNACPANQNSLKLNDGRMTMANFGKGLALPPGDGADLDADSHNWWANTAEANCYANGVDIPSVDMYWFTDPYDGPDHRYGYLYGENVKNLRRAGHSRTARHSRSGTSSRPATRSPSPRHRAVEPSCPPSCGRLPGTPSSPAPGASCGSSTPSADRTRSTITRSGRTPRAPARWSRAWMPRSRAWLRS